MKVLITVPNLHWIHKLVVHKLLLLQMDGRHKTTIMMPSNKPFENNLHHIVNDFMNGDWDFWLSMDDDNPPTQNPLDLVDLDLDIIGLPTPIWHFEGKVKGERPIYWNAYKLSENGQGYNEWPTKEGLQEVDAIGTGCFLMSRRVFENKEMRKAPFQRVWYDDGTVKYGNDIAFCRRAKENRFKIHVHFEYPCDHMSELSLMETGRAFREMKHG